MTTQTATNRTAPACQSGDCTRPALGTSGWCKLHLLFPTDRVDTTGRRTGVVGENLNNANSDDLETED